MGLFKTFNMIVIDFGIHWFHDRLWFSMPILLLLGQIIKVLLCLTFKFLKINSSIWTFLMMSCVQMEILKITVLTLSCTQKVWVLQLNINIIGQVEAFKKIVYWESLEELLLESVDITSTSSVSLLWFRVSIETLPWPLTVMWISPEGCHANWFCWEAGSSGKRK